MLNGRNDCAGIALTCLERRFGGRRSRRAAAHALRSWAEFAADGRTRRAIIAVSAVREEGGGVWRVLVAGEGGGGQGCYEQR